MSFDGVGPPVRDAMDHPRRDSVGAAAPDVRGLQELLNSQRRMLEGVDVSFRDYKTEMDKIEVKIPNRPRSARCRAYYPTGVWERADEIDRAANTTTSTSAASQKTATAAHPTSVPRKRPESARTPGSTSRPPRNDTLGDGGLAWSNLCDSITQVVRQAVNGQLPHLSAFGETIDRMACAHEESLATQRAMLAKMEQMERRMEQLAEERIHRQSCDQQAYMQHSTTSAWSAGVQSHPHMSPTEMKKHEIVIEKVHERVTRDLNTQLAGIADQLEHLSLRVNALHPPARSMALHHPERNVHSRNSARDTPDTMFDETLLIDASDGHSDFNFKSPCLAIARQAAQSLHKTESTAFLNSLTSPRADQTPPRALTASQSFRDVVDGMLFGASRVSIPIVSVNPMGRSTKDDLSESPKGSETPVRVSRSRDDEMPMMERATWSSLRKQLLAKGVGERFLSSLYAIQSGQDGIEDFAAAITSELAKMMRCQEVHFNFNPKFDFTKGLASLVQNVTDNSVVALDGASVTREPFDPDVDSLLTTPASYRQCLVVAVKCKDTVYGVLKLYNRMARLPRVPEGQRAEPSFFISETSAVARWGPIAVDPEFNPHDLSGKAWSTEERSRLDAFISFAMPGLRSLVRRRKDETDKRLLAKIVETVQRLRESHRSTQQEIAALGEACAMDLLPSASVKLYLLSSDRSNLLSRGSRVPFTETCGFVGDVLRTGQPVLVPDVSVDPRANRAYQPDATVQRVSSVLCCPIHTDQNGVAGVVELVNKVGGVYEQFDVILMESLCGYLAVTFQNQSVMKLLDESHRRANVMIDVCRDLTAVALDSSALQHKIMERAKVLVNADRASLFLADWRRKHLVTTIEGTEVNFPMNKGIAGTVAVTGENLNITDAYSDNRFNKAIDLKSGYQTRTLLTVPVKHEGRVVAVAQLVNKKDCDNPLDIVCFDDEDESLLESFGTFAGISLRISEQYLSLEKEKAKVNLMLDAVIGLADVDIRDGLLHICRSIMHSAKKLLCADRCSLFLIDKENGQLYSCVTDQQGGEIRFSIREGIAGQVVRLGTTLNIPDAYKNRHFNMENDRKRGYRTRSMLASPVKFDGEVIAVMQLINKVSGEKGSKGDEALAFDEDDEKAISYFCTLAGISIRNAQLYEFTMKGCQELSNVLNSMSAPGGEVPQSTSPRAMHTDSKQSQMDKDELALFEQTMAIIAESMDAEVESMSTTEFDINAYVNVTDGRARLVYLCAEMFAKRGLTELYCIDRPTLLRFIIRLTLGYRKVPYHNVYHALDVTQTMYNFFTRLPAGTLSQLEELALLVASICHDVDHMGLNNSFHYKAETPLGILSSATGASSPLEVHHVNYSIALLQRPQYNILANIPDPGDAVAFYKLFVKVILGTDMASHGKLCDAFKQIEAHNIKPAERETALILLLKSADISNCTKPFEISRVWAYRVLDEFYLQGDAERANLGEVSNEMFDRNNGKEVAESQLGFIRFVAKPFYTITAGVFPELQYLLDQLCANENVWDGVNVKQKEAKARLAADTASAPTSPTT